MQKTVVVLVERMKKSSKMDKLVRYRKKFKAHDEHGACNMGDQVRIHSSRPISKTKAWVVGDILKKNPAVMYQQKKLAEQQQQQQRGFAASATTPSS